MPAAAACCLKTVADSIAPVLMSEVTSWTVSPSWPDFLSRLLAFSGS